MFKLNKYSKIEIYPTVQFGTLSDKHNRYPLVRTGTTVNLKVTEKVIKILLQSEKGQSVGKISVAINLDVSQTINIVTELIKFGIISAIDGRPIKDPAPRIQPWFASYSQHKLSWLVKSTNLALMVLFIISGIVIAFINPNLIPSYTDYFWTSDLFVVFLSLFFLDILFLFLHELGHLLITKAAGGEASISLSVRYIYLVAETKSFYLSLQPQYKRLFVYAAGIFTDMLIITTLLWCLFFFNQLPYHQTRTIQGILSATLLLQFSRIIWQYNIAIKTDLYNVLTELIGHRNIKEQSLNHAKNAILRLIRPSTVRLLEGQTAKKKLIVTYLIILGIGLSFATYEFFYLSLPRLIIYLTQGYQDLLQAITFHDYKAVTKSTLFLFLVSFNYLMVFHLYAQKARKWHQKP